MTLGTENGGRVRGVGYRRAKGEASGFHILMNEQHCSTGLFLAIFPIFVSANFVSLLYLRPYFHASLTPL